MVRVPVSGTALRTYDTPYLDGVEPYEHQRRLDALIETEDEFFAVNSTSTGGGKTWSYWKPAVERCINLLCIYPTNPLVSDQIRAACEFLAEFYPDRDVIMFNDEYPLAAGRTGDVALINLTSEGVQKLAENSRDDLSTSATIERVVSRANQQCEMVMVFTNPDMFTLMRRNMMGNGDARSMSNLFEMVAVDEFHLASVKGRNTLLHLLYEMYERSNNRTALSKVLFLSATPEKSLRDTIENHLDAPFYNLADKSDQQPLDDDVVDLAGNWRGIMPAVDLDVREGQTFRTWSELLDPDTIDEFVRFCTQGRTVVMLDGSHEVNVVYNTLEDRLPGAQDVFRISGFYGHRVEEKLDRFESGNNVLVSNSAVEVGIDFEVDQLLFSAPNASSFMQRIGRLRGVDDPETPVRARCYVPRSVLDRFERIPEWSDQRLSREALEDIVFDTYGSSRDPPDFAPTYTALEAVAHMVEMMDDNTYDLRGDYWVNAVERLEKTCFDPYDKEFTDDTLRTLKQRTTEHEQVVETLQQYRESGLQTLVYNPREGTVSAQNTFYLLSNCNVEFVPESAFESRLLSDDADCYTAFQQSRENAIGYCIFYGLYSPDDESDGRNVGLIPGQSLRTMLEQPVEDRHPTGVTGLELTVKGDTCGITGLKHLNDELREESILCYPHEGTSFRIQMLYNLDDFFFLYQLAETPGQRYVALGMNALYLHCHSQAGTPQSRLTDELEQAWHEDHVTPSATPDT